MRSYFKDPKNLRYRLSIIIPIVVFLTSLLSAISIQSYLGGTFERSYPLVLGTSLFCALCSFFIAIGITKPLEEILKRAGQLVRFEGRKTDKGQMIEIYDLIEKLIEIAKERNREGAGKNPDVLRGLEKLDYLLPLGYMSLMVAHEVRNPLSTIVGMNELLGLRIVDPKLKEYIKVSQGAAGKIDEFTRELLDFGDDELSCDTFDINEVVDDVLHHMSIRFPAVSVEFRRCDVIPYEADRNKIFQALSNIIKNACEYEQNGGMVRISCEKKAGNVVVTVFNRSSKIEREDLDMVFKPFFTKKKGGKGIGLFVCMKNVRLHGGQVVAESDDSGTTFSVSLPLDTKQ